MANLESPMAECHSSPKHLSPLALTSPRVLAPQEEATSSVFFLTSPSFSRFKPHGDIKLPEVESLPNPTTCWRVMLGKYLSCHRDCNFQGQPKRSQITPWQRLHGGRGSCKCKHREAPEPPRRRLRRQEPVETGLPWPKQLSGKASKPGRRQRGGGSAGTVPAP